MRITYIRLISCCACVLLTCVVVEYSNSITLLTTNSQLIIGPSFESHMSRHLSDKNVRSHQLPEIMEITLFDALRHSIKHNYKNKFRHSTLGSFLDYYPDGGSPTPEVLRPWQVFVNNINRHRFHSDKSYVDEMIEAMKTLPISTLTEKPNEGTEYKFFFELSDGTPIIGKPLRLLVDNDAPPWMNKNDFYERFQSEVAAFQLSRLLKFNFVPPVISRYVNLISEIRPLMSNTNINDTFFVNADGATCFIGKCPKKCDGDHAICGQPHLLPVSFAFFIPGNLINGWIENPVHVLSQLRYTNKRYCERLKTQLTATTNASRSYLDLVDINIFDFIQGNLDRHHYGKITTFGENSHVILFDNGRGFAREYQDEYDLLFPLSKCCQIRLSTFENLIKIYNTSGRLSGAMRKTLQTELVQPLLTDAHLQALDRRLIKVLEVVYSCVGMDGSHVDRIIIHDGV